MHQTNGIINFKTYNTIQNTDEQHKLMEQSQSHSGLFLLAMHIYTRNLICLEV